MSHYAKPCRSRPNKKNKSVGRLQSADESDSEQSSGRTVVRNLESRSILSAKIYIGSPVPSNNPQQVTLAPDIGVSNTLLNRLDWEKVKHLCTFLKTSKSFRPFGTAYHLPVKGKVKVTLPEEKGATIKSYIYVVEDKREQSLLGDKDAIHLNIVKLHPQGVAESEAQVSRRISYSKRTKSPKDGIMSGEETQAEMDANMAKLASQFPAFFSTKTGKFQGLPNKIQVHLMPHL